MGESCASSNTLFYSSVETYIKELLQIKILMSLLMNVSFKMCNTSDHGRFLMCELLLRQNSSNFNLYTKFRNSVRQLVIFTFNMTNDSPVSPRIHKEMKYLFLPLLEKWALPISEVMFGYIFLYFINLRAPSLHGFPSVVTKYTTVSLRY